MTRLRLDVLFSHFHFYIAMLILVLGASSYVGAALAEAFAPNNDLILVGRDVDRLMMAANKCRNSGASQVAYIEQDFAQGVSAVLQAIEGKRIDLVIDAASASSRYRDTEIEPNDIPRYVSADFLSRTAIMDHILRNQDSAPAMIFISTVLTLVKSPARRIYAALKTLNETYLTKIKNSRPDFYLLIVYVGTVIDTTRETHKPKTLAAAVFQAFDNKNEKLFFGLSGIFLLILFYFQPILYYGVTIAQRRIRRLLG
jgi:NADP-dependent 3-hydroxy acid dehydrogenase YdfG